MPWGTPGAATTRVSALFVGKLSGSKTGCAGWDLESYGPHMS